MHHSRVLPVIFLFFLLNMSVHAARDIVFSGARKVEVPIIQASLNWQKSPAGVGEFLPNAPLYSGLLDIDGAQIAYTSMGLLRKNTGGSWSIVPATYGNTNINFVQLFNNLLWVGSATHGLLALNPRDCSVQRRLPGVRGRCFMLGAKEIWSVEEIVGNEPKRGYMAGTALVEYDGDGKELHRYRVAASPTDNQGATFPHGEIRWEAVDEQAIWVLHRIPSREMNDGRADYKMAVLYRIDRNTGTMRTIPALFDDFNFDPQSQQDEIYWIFRDAVYRLDKHTLELTCLGSLPENAAANLVLADEHYLWRYTSADTFEQARVEVFSLRDLASVPLANAGTPPAEISALLGRDFIVRRRVFSY